MTPGISSEQALRLAQVKTNLLNTNQAQIIENKDNNVTPEINNGDKKSMDKLKWAGIIAAGALAVAGVGAIIKRGKVFDVSVVKDEAGKITRKINGKTLTFKDKMPMLDDKKVDGIFRFKAPNGVVLTYKDGILQNSIKKGEKGFEKIYENGLIKTVKKLTADGIDEYTFKRANDGKLTEILKNNEALTKFMRNESGNVEKIVKGTDETLLQYNAQGKLEKITNGSNLTEILYDKEGKIDKINKGEIKLTESVAEAQKNIEAPSDKLEEVIGVPEKVEEIAEATEKPAVSVQEPEKIQAENKQIKTPTLKQKLSNAKRRSGDIDKRLTSLKKKGHPTEAIKPEIIEGLKQLKPETVSALSNEQLMAICSIQTPEKCVDRLQLLETQFTADELRLISVKDSSLDLVNWISQVFENPKEEAELLNTLKAAAEKI